MSIRHRQVMVTPYLLNSSILKQRNERVHSGHVNVYLAKYLRVMFIMASAEISLQEAEIILSFTIQGHLSPLSGCRQVALKRGGET